MSIISKRLNLKPRSVQRRRETRINPFTREHNCGYWELRTEEISTDDSLDAQLALLTLIDNRIDEIECILTEFAGDAIFRIFVESTPHNLPGLMLEDAFLSAVNRLHGKLEIVLTLD